MSTVPPNAAADTHSPTNGQLLPPPHLTAGSSVVSPPPVHANATNQQEIWDPKHRYVRKNYLAKGANKIVFRAFDEEEGIEVAWNEIDAASIADITKVRREIELLQKMNHPHIIRCHDSWYDDERRALVFVTELMTSGTLADFVGQQSTHSLKPHVMSKYCNQILSGLVYLHQHEVIHRDLKCNNIFINGHKGEVKIGDLGLSIASRAANSVIGTPEYMAPEIYEENYTNAVDIWSFGMCMLEMLSGERPYGECENIAQIFKKVTNGVLPLAKDKLQDPALRDVILDCLALDGNKRPSAEELLANPLFSTKRAVTDENGGDPLDGGDHSRGPPVIHPDVGAAAVWDGLHSGAASAHDGHCEPQFGYASTQTDDVALTFWDHPHPPLDPSHRAALITRWLHCAPSWIRSDVIQHASQRAWITDAQVQVLTRSTTWQESNLPMFLPPATVLVPPRTGAGLEVPGLTLDAIMSQNHRGSGPLDGSGNPNPATDQSAVSTPGGPSNSKPPTSTTPVVSADDIKKRAADAEQKLLAEMSRLTPASSLRDLREVRSQSSGGAGPGVSPAIVTVVAPLSGTGEILTSFDFEQSAEVDPHKGHEGVLRTAPAA